MPDGQMRILFLNYGYYYLNLENVSGGWRSF